MMRVEVTVKRNDGRRAEPGDRIPVKRGCPVTTPTGRKVGRVLEARASASGDGITLTLDLDIRTDYWLDSLGRVSL